MRIRVFLKKNVLILISILTIITSVPMYAQQSMSLGGLKFVMPDQKTMRSSRVLHMKMARTGISARVIAKVGGVAFIQTAEPYFAVKSLKLGINIENNAYAVINDTTYEIPLEVWELQSIVNFANKEENAAVTLFGDNSSRIQYHDAFLDNLMGLRILQTDLIFTSFLKPSDRGKLPSYSNGNYIMSPDEKQVYKSWSKIDSLYYQASYEEVSQYYSYKVIQMMDSIGESYDTYIYTDYGQPIKFKTQNNHIEFEGSPYYRFACRDSLLVDTLEMYCELRNFVDTFNLQRNKYKDLSISKVFKKSGNPVIYDLIKLTKKKMNIQKKAATAFELSNYYALCDSFGLNDDNRFMNYFKPLILKSYIENYSDSILHYGSGNSELDNLCSEFLSIKDSLKHYDYPIVTAYVNSMYNLLPNDSTISSIYEISKKFGLTYDRLMIEYMYNHKIPAAKTLVNITNFMREHRIYTYMINPIVFNAADKTCQWSAFFRYVKENYEEEWESFANNVKRLKYDAPIVQTPIDFTNEEDHE